MSGAECDVCGKPSVGVASSAFGPMSFAFCSECASKPAEPIFIFIYLYETVSDQGKGLVDDVDRYFTFLKGEYVSWPDYVARRNEGAVHE